MKTKHTEYTISCQLDPQQEPRLNLATLVEENIRKPVKGSGYGVLLPEQLQRHDTKEHIVQE